MSFTIASHKIGPNLPPFIVAELSGNHGHSLDTALALVDAAKSAGAHAVKLQTYTADTMTLDINEGEFFISDPNSLWHGRSLYDLYKEACTPWEWHPILFDRCRDLGLIAFSTPFDASAVDFLESLNTPCYKIASLEIVDLPLIKKAASTGKPLMLSTGGATVQEIQDAIDTATKAGCKELLLLKCAIAYPAPIHAMNLRTISDMEIRFKCPIGLSDHSLGIAASVASVALGCCLIEKHLTLSRKEGAVDSGFSLEPYELEQLVKASKEAWEASGTVHYGPLPEEVSTLSYRRSLYFSTPLKKGQAIKPENVKSIRPGKGLPPKDYFSIMGLKVHCDVKRGQPVTWDVLQR